MSTIHEGDTDQGPDSGGLPAQDHALIGTVQRIPARKRGQKWPDHIRTEALAWALTHGHHQAAERLGIPRRTISKWALESATDGTLNTLVAANRDLLVSRFAEAVNVGITAVLAGLRDPSTRLGDRARALEVVSRQHALLVGDPTVRTQSQNLNLSADVDPQDYAALRDAIDQELEIRESGPLTEAELAELAEYLRAKEGWTDVG